MATVVVTGANRGIGLQLARKYAARLDEVYACCRTSNPDLEAVSGVQVIPDVDVTQPDSLGPLKRHLGRTKIDILVNNAGILHVDGIPSIDAESLARQFQVNSIAPLLVTQSLLNNLTQPGAKVAMITSQMGSIEDNHSGGYYGYRMSKAALNIAGVSLARDLRSHGITVGLIHPGYVATDMTEHRGSIQAADSARGIIQVIDHLDLEKTGQFFSFSGSPLPW